jgi:hypothetical protein
VISHGHCSDFFKFEQIFVKDFNPKLGVRWVRWIWMSWTEHAWEVGNSKRIIIRVALFVELGDLCLMTSQFFFLDVITRFS